MLIPNGFDIYNGGAGNDTLDLIIPLDSNGEPIFPDDPALQTFLNEVFNDDLFVELLQSATANLNQVTDFSPTGWNARLTGIENVTLNGEPADFNDGPEPEPPIVTLLDNGTNGDGFINAAQALGGITIGGDIQILKMGKK